MATTLSTLIELVSKRVGDWLEDIVTTALTTNLTVTSTNLAKYTNIANQFARQWVYIEDKANAGAIRRITSSTTGALTCIGTNFVSDGANLATFQIHKYNPDDIIDAINRACREVRSDLFISFRDSSIETTEDTTEYALPDEFQVAGVQVNKVSIQVTSDVEQYLLTNFWNLEFDGTEYVIVLPQFEAGLKIKIEGTCPLESNLSALTDEVSLDNPYVQALVEYAAYCLLDGQIGSPTALDKKSIQQEAMRHLTVYKQMIHQGLRMPRVQSVQRLKQTYLVTR